MIWFAFYRGLPKSDSDAYRDWSVVSRGVDTLGNFYVHLLSLSPRAMPGALCHYNPIPAKARSVFQVFDIPKMPEWRRLNRYFCLFSVGVWIFFLYFSISFFDMILLCC